jgi:hypothetical protein
MVTVNWILDFEVDGIHLSQARVRVSERIELERISTEYESKAHVIMSVDQKETDRSIPSYRRAWELLDDFLSAYLAATGFSARIVRELGGSTTADAGKYGASVSGGVELIVRPTVSESKSIGMMEQAKKYLRYPKVPTSH